MKGAELRMIGGRNIMDLTDAEFSELDDLLAATPEGENIVFDYQSTGLTLRRHPLAILRPVLAKQGWCTAAELHDLPDGRLARACGVTVEWLATGGGDLTANRAITVTEASEAEAADVGGERPRAHDHADQDSLEGRHMRRSGV